MDSRQRFSATVDHYDANRPDYPAALLAALLADLPEDPCVMDVGAGTGILSRQIAAEGIPVLAVEPNEDMRRVCLRKAMFAGLPLSVVEGEGADLPVPDGVADLILAAQAWHWFANAAALAEWRRVLKPGGLAAAVWNFRLTGDGGLMDAYDALLRAFSSEYGVVTKGERALAWLEAQQLPKARRQTFEHAQEHDLDGLLGRALSSSYVVHGVADMLGFTACLEALFAEHQQGGVVRFAYRTELLTWGR